MYPMLRTCLAALCGLLLVAHHAVAADSGMQPEVDELHWLKTLEQLAALSRTIHEEVRPQVAAAADYAERVASSVVDVHAAGQYLFGREGELARSASAGTPSSSTDTHTLASPSATVGFADDALVLVPADSKTVTLHVLCSDCDTLPSPTTSLCVTVSTVTVAAGATYASAQPGLDYEPVDRAQLTWSSLSPDTVSVTVQLLMGPTVETVRRFNVSLDVCASSAATPVWTRRTVQLQLPQDVYCNNGTNSIASRTQRFCNGSVVSDAQFAQLQLPGNLTCQDVAVYFNTSVLPTPVDPLFNMSQISAADRAIIDSACTGATDATVLIYCQYFRNCDLLSTCANRNDTLEFCQCPLDSYGKRCEAPTPAECTLTLLSPNPKCTEANAVAGLKSQYDWSLYGIPPCVLTSSVSAFKFSLSCRFTVAAKEGPSSLWPLTGYTYTPVNFTSSYSVLLPDKSFARSASAPLNVTVKVYNMRRLSDSSQVFRTAVTTAALLPGATLDVAVNMAALVDKYQAGGRIYVEYGLEQGYGVPTAARRSLVLDAANYSPPPYVASKLSRSVVIVIVVAVLFAVAGAAFLIYKRWRKQQERVFLSQGQAQPLLGFAAPRPQ